jgi:hypothetical protein
VVEADGVATTTITVLYYDVLGLPIVGAEVFVTADSGSAVVDPASVFTDGAGQAVFTATDATPESGITFTADIPADTVTIGPSNAVNFYDAGLADAGESTIEASPLEVLADGVDEAAIVVTVRNAGGGVISGKTVTVAADLGAAVVAPASDVTDVGGVANFTATDTTIESGITFTADVPADTVTIGPSNAVDFIDPVTSVGPVYAMDVSDDAGFGSLAWSNPANAQDVEDTTYAVVVFDPIDETSHWLRAVAFNWPGLWPGKAILGIQFEYRNASCLSAVRPWWRSKCPTCTDLQTRG